MTVTATFALDAINESHRSFTDFAKAKKYMLKAEELGYSDEADLTAMYAEIASCLFDEEDYSRAAQYYIKAADSDQNNSNDARNAGFAFQCAKGEICGMDIHPDFEYPIHEVTSFACGKPRSWRDFASDSIRVNPRCCKC